VTKFNPGGDAQAIWRIAADHYGGALRMFEAHEWPERGADMMRKVQTRVKESYGSVAAFVDQHDKAVK
jgi:hypothetical protein